MKLLLDTDVCINAINQRSPGPLLRLREYTVGEVGISAITYTELRYAVENNTRTTENVVALERFVLPLEVAPFDAEAGRSYGKVRSQLERAGRPIGGNDLLIAAHALSLDATLVTGNVREFGHVEGLAIVTWE